MRNASEPGFALCERSDRHGFGVIRVVLPPSREEMQATAERLMAAAHTFNMP